MSLLRSLLFVPGDSERKQVKALGAPADAILLDLEDSVAEAQLPAARVRVRDLLASHPDRSRRQLWVRVNSLSSGRLLPDLAAVFPGTPDGIVVPKAGSPAEVVQIAHYLEALEVAAGREVGGTRVLVIASETAEAVLTMNTYAQVLAAAPAARRRLAGLTWGSEDLSADLGVTAKSDASGALTLPFQMARSLCLMAAASVGVQAIDGVFADFRNTAGLVLEAQAGRRDGFTGKLAIHPDQVPVINESFTPTAAEQDWARRVQAAFAGSPGAGVLALDGQMIDKPHLRMAERILELARQR